MKNAFTLAEVLVTLGIIGVVAAITLPTLVANYKEKVLVNQVKKSYSEMQNALASYAAQNNCTDISCISDTTQTKDELANKLFAQFKNAKKCPNTHNSKRPTCKSIGIKNNTPYYEDGVAAYPDGLTPAFITASGTAYQLVQNKKCPAEYEYTLRDANGFVIMDENNKPKTKKSTYYTCAMIYFDANGVNKGPNQYGADIYRFNINYNGKLEPFTSIQSVLADGKLNYTPHQIGQSKK